MSDDGGASAFEIFGEALASESPGAADVFSGIHEELVQHEEASAAAAAPPSEALSVPSGYDGAWSEIVGRLEEAAAETECTSALSPTVSSLQDDGAETSAASLQSSDAAWSEILGADAWSEIVGAGLDKSSAFRDFLNRRVAASRPMVTRMPYQDMKDWTIDFGPAFAPAGERLVLTNNPQCLFRGEKIMATDTGEPAGYGTRVTQVVVGQKLQKPANGSTLTAFFANNAIGNGVRFDTSDKAIQIAVTVEYIQSCTFYMSVWGTSVS